MKNKLRIIGALVVVTAVAVVVMKLQTKKDSGETTREIAAHTGKIQTTVSATATVLPKNRLQLTPPVAGRVDSILVQEGQMVKKGQVLGWLSSTERAALLDAAQEQGPEKLKYWQEVYKPIALVAPIDGEVIVATVQPGQAVATSDAVLVLSDRMIVRAQVDETDIGKIKEGQAAVIGLDAYPDVKIKAVVDHIYYESETVNNVTIYKVDLVPETTPAFFRSGMNANVDFVTESRENALLLPQEAVYSENGANYVLLSEGGQPVKRTVTLGLTQDKNVEIVSGITQDDTVLMKSKRYSLPKSGTAGKNPFLPSRKPASGSNNAGDRTQGR